MSNLSILVMGGGASGMMAAIAAARCGATVTVLERLDRVGKKILATGNGRCNLTNAGDARYYGTDPSFARAVIDRFPVDRTIALFTDLGLLCSEEEEGRVYPLCGQASAVLDVMRAELDRTGVTVICGTGVGRISRTHGGFEIRTAQGQSFTADTVILATGGKAAPQLGSDGSGFHLAKDLGHRCIEPFPGLVQLNLDAPFLKQVDGVKVTGSVAMTDGDRILRRERGELLFTSYGMSGIPIMQVSRSASGLLSRTREAFLEIDIFPDLSEDEIAGDIDRRLRRWPLRPLDASLIGFVHKRLIPVVLRSAGIEQVRKPTGELTSEEIARLVALVKKWRLRITGTQPWSRAQVTAGGIATDEIDSRTMESRIVPGLYFAGEVVDIDGDCGGYNLQWAWSSGSLAGSSAAKG